ncbi:MAG: PepSY domain-containing protein [Mesorhizobium sp.]|nr:PepSY domain-containing protein [Mesorhizobium sp.]MCO5162194.1 PepSY domain-containing protein [Mesorhizobium sp.]
MRVLLAACFAVLIASVSPALADKGGDADRRAVERARERGEILPLARIIELLRAQGLTGDVLEVELENDDAGVVYEIYLLGPGGRRLEIKVDPATGRILERDHD